MVTFNEGGSNEPQRVVRRLGRIEGVTNERVTQATENGAAIDFTLGFPFNPLVPERNRSPLVSNSSISLDDEGMVDTLTYRYPPLPADIWQHGAAFHMMEQYLKKYDTTGLMEVQINPGNGEGDVEQWYPHVLFLHFERMEPDTALDFLSQSLSDYLTEAREETERLKDQM